MSQHEIYRQQVRDAFARRTGAVLLNSCIEHAAIITCEAFKNAKKSVRILAHKLDPECYANESVKNAIDSFLATPDHKLQILVESGLWDENNVYNWRQHPLLKHFIKSGEGENPQLELRRVPRALSENYKFNFLLMDDNAYRYESNRDKPTAVAVSLPEGQEEKTANMRKAFSDLWQQSQRVALS